MKTIEEKAKAYDEAIERAKEVIRKMNMYDGTCIKEDIEDIFPQLAESEDERIRKKLIGIFTNQSLCDVYNLKSEDVLAYLEKQKEQKPAMSREKILHQLFQNGSITLSDYLYLTEEQKPAEKQDYSGLTDFERAIHRGFLCAGVENVPVTIIRETAQDCLAHLPAEWSEEEEDNIYLLLCMVDAVDSIPYINGTLRVSDEKKKELKEFIKRPHWKPSEEQIQAIIYLASSIPPNFLKEQEYTMRLVDEVISNLKKLCQ